MTWAIWRRKVKGEGVGDRNPSCRVVMVQVHDFLSTRKMPRCYFPEVCTSRGAVVHRYDLYSSARVKLRELNGVIVDFTSLPNFGDDSSFLCGRELS